MTFRKPTVLAVLLNNRNSYDKALKVISWYNSSAVEMGHF